MTDAAKQFSEFYPDAVLTARERKLRGFWAGTGPRSLLSIHDGRAAYRQIEDDDLIVANAVRQILDSARLSDDYLPWFGPDFGTVSMALPWGGEVVRPQDGKIFIKPVIFSPEDAERALAGDPAGFDVARAVRLTRQVRERLGTDRVWSRAIDFQGPLSTAGLLWEQTDLFCSMITHPEIVHRFLARVTDYLIATTRAQLAGMGPLCGMIWPYIWLPDDLGIVFTEDLMPLLSAEMYREFGIPYMKRLAETFGGAFIHCCGAFEQHLPALAASGAPFLGFDYCEPYTRTEPLFEAFGPKMVYHAMMGIHGAAKWGDYHGFLQNHLARQAPREMRFWFCLDAASPDTPRVAECVKRHFIERI